MALETVEILIEDNTPAHDPVEGVVVRVYDVTGTTIVTQDTTDVTGKVAMVLDGGSSSITYQIRTYKMGVSAPQPKYIEVFSPASGSSTGTNNFRLRADTFVLPEAMNPRLCRVSGIVYGPNGRPRPGIDIHFVYRFNPLIVDGIGVLGERVAVRTDRDGYVEFDLWRCGCYRAIIESHENTGRDIHVPDLASVNLMHLLFPRVQSVVFDPPAPWAISVGAELSVGTEVVLTSGYVIKSTATEDLTYSLEDSGIVSASALEDTIVLRGIAAGSTQLKVTRNDESLIYVPDLDVVGNDSTITVV